MRYVEHENVTFRGEAPPGFPMSEKLVGGEWIPAGASGHNAALYGRPIEASEAEADGGDKEKATAKA